MHITSLPSPYGIGSMGKAAYDFIDFLRAAKQTYWQILPINPPGYGDSPYQAFSTFAGNPYLIDLDELVKDGYLTQEELDRVDWGSRADQVDFSKMYDQRLRVLHLAWSRFHKAPTERYTEYVRQQSAWLEEYVLFMAVKAYYNDGRGPSGRSISGCTSRRPWRTTVSCCTTSLIFNGSCSSASIRNGSGCGSMPMKTAC